MKIFIVTIDHGKPALTNRLVMSIISQFDTNIDIELLVVENSGKVSISKYNFLDIIKPNLSCHVCFLENLGYFGSAAKAISDFLPLDVNWIIVCNNDLQFASDFMAVLEARTPYLVDRLLLCPNIFENGRSINPLSQGPYPNFKVKFWDFYYKHVTFARAYEVFRLRISRLKLLLQSCLKQPIDDECEIYLGYGAMFIINPDFLGRAGGLPNETFLYQEESVICSYVRRFGDQPYYIPSLKVFHDSHATLSSLAFESDFALRREAWWKTRHHLIA